MTEQPRTREELYERIRSSSKEIFILEDMIRLGFWPAQGEMPQDPADEIRRRNELNKELNDLRNESRKLNNEQALLKKLRQERLVESKKKQKETKERQEKERKEQAETWKIKKNQDIVFLGENVSGGLNQKESNEERLKIYYLPLLNCADDIAQKMGITIGALRFLAFSRKVSPINHYKRFKVPKKTGGFRLISAPMPKLKNIQYWILENILNKITPHDATHGFRKSCSIVSNAKRHLNTDVVINLDLENFFPSISYKRVKGLFRSLGYSDSVATIFGLICTEPDIEEAELDGKTWFIPLSERHLPQGAPTSPAITNLLCRRLDKRLEKMANKRGFKYTRYADDLTFSGSGEDLKNICNILKNTESIVTHEGFTVHPKKTRVVRASRQQEVTGVVVNEKLNVDKETLKKFRATLYQIEKDGPDGKKWGHSNDIIASIQGFANFVRMVNPEKGQAFQEQVKRIITKYNWKPEKKRFTKTSVHLEKTGEETKNIPVNESPKPEEEKKKWWKLF